MSSVDEMLQINSNNVDQCKLLARISEINIATVVDITHNNCIQTYIDFKYEYQKLWIIL